MKCVKKNDIIDENDPLSEYNKIPLVTIAPMPLFTAKSTSKFRPAPHISHSIVIPRFIPLANTAQS